MGNANGKKPEDTKKAVRCAIYTRKSTDEGLNQDFNSLDAQREAAEAFVLSQRSEGWQALPDHFDDGGYTGGNMERPALKRLLTAIAAQKVDCVVVYKVDRLSRSLLDFVKMMELFDRHGVSFVSVTQQFNTTSSLGRLTLNILLSFAQFEREIISERTRDKMSAARRKGKWVGGLPVLGYDIDLSGGKLTVNAEEARRVRAIFELYLESGSLLPVVQELEKRNWRMKSWTTRGGISRHGKFFTKSALHRLLTNVIYTGRVDHKGTLYRGEHEAIIDLTIWEQVQKNLRRADRTGGSSTRNRYGALLRVNDLKQYEYCPRIVFYNTVMPVERKITVKMERGTEEEVRLDALEKRRSLKRYQLALGQRHFHVWLESEKLGLSGKLDMLIVSPAGHFPVDFKYSRGKPHRNHVYQLAGYALLVEEAYQIEVKTAFIYMAPLQQILQIGITSELKSLTLGLLGNIREMIRDGILPPPTPVRARCEECEFRNYCGDIF